MIVLPDKPRMWTPGLRSGHPLLRGLAGFWPLWDIGSGTAHDLSPLRKHGTLVNMSSSSWLPGRGLDFVAGSSQSITLPAGTAEAGTGDITISAVLIPSNTAAYQTILSTRKAGGGGTQCGHMLAMDTSDRVYWLVDDGAGSYILANAAGTALTVGVPQHVIAIFRQGDGVYAYVNGKLGASDTSPTISGNITGGWSPRIGATCSPNLYCDSTLIHVTVWHRAFSAAEIAEHTEDPFGMCRQRRRTYIYAKAAAAPASGGPFPHYLRRAMQGGFAA